MIGVAQVNLSEIPRPSSFLRAFLIYTGMYSFTIFCKIISNLAAYTTCIYYLTALEAKALFMV